jgi:hypothetical protein
MSDVSEAFEKMRKGSEITQKEQEQAKSRHRRIRDVIASNWDLDDPASFLTGSYDRHTKIKRLRDVDIFVVVDLDGSQGHFRDQRPRLILDELSKLLHGDFPDVDVDRMAVRVSFDPDDDVASFEVVPVFVRSGGGYWIPDDKLGKWIATDPNEHARLSTEKNEACNEKYVPFVKMAKGWNRENGDPIWPSFLLEVMALKIVPVPLGRYQDEMVTFLATAADRIGEPWPDPAHLGPDVNAEMSSIEILTAKDALQNAQELANEAVILEDEGREREAVDKWRGLFGNRMPRP